MRGNRHWHLVYSFPSYPFFVCTSRRRKNDEERKEFVYAYALLTLLKRRKEKVNLKMFTHKAFALVCGYPPNLYLWDIGVLPGVTPFNVLMFYLGY